MPLQSPRSRTWRRETEGADCAANNRVKEEDSDAKGGDCRPGLAAGS